MNTTTESTAPHPVVRRIPVPPRPAPHRVGGWVRALAILGVIFLAGSLLGARHVLQIGDIKLPLQKSPQAVSLSPSDARVVCHGYYDTELPLQALSPLQPGRVIEVLAVEGREYAKGEPLLRVDDSAAVDAIALAEIAVQVAETKVDQARQLTERFSKGLAEQEVAIIAAERRADAADADAESVKKTVGTIATQEQLNAKLQVAAACRVGVNAERAKLETLKASRPDGQVDEATRNLNLTKRRLEQARRAREDFVVLAPEAGRVLRVGTSIGTVLGPQTKVPPIVFLPKDGKRFVRAELEQEVAHRVRKDMEADVCDKFNRSNKWQGKVVSIADAYMPRRFGADSMMALGEARVLECLIELAPGSELSLPKIGQPLRIEIAAPK